MSRVSMSTEPEAMRLADALDAEFVQGRISNSTGRESAVELRRLHEINQDLLKALHEALETEQEPVAWMHNFIEGNVITHIPADIVRHPERWTPLYTAPPKQWVSLTDEEVSDVIDDVLEGGGWLDVARALELASKRKNT